MAGLCVAVEEEVGVEERSCGGGGQASEQRRQEVSEIARKAGTMWRSSGRAILPRKKAAIIERLSFGSPRPRAPGGRRREGVHSVAVTHVLGIRANY